MHGYPACGGFDCYGAGQWITQRLFGGAKWTDSDELAEQMFAAYRQWIPRFAAAALIESALPYVRDDARCSLVVRMTELTDEQTSGLCNTIDAARLHRETLAAIRLALRSEPE
jgi:hypothetical protein